jgi:hypothetical protein
MLVPLDCRLRCVSVTSVIKRIFLLDIFRYLGDCSPAMTDTDLEFRKWADTLRHIRFVSPLLEPESRAAESSRAKPHNVYPLAGRWFVKSYLGGCQRLWVIRDDFAGAARIADMIIFRFHKYRRTAWRALTDEDFNITLAHAKLDLENEPEIKSILMQMEALLIKADVLEEEPGQNRGRYVTAASKMEKQFIALSRQIADLQNQVSELLAGQSAAEKVWKEVESNSAWMKRHCFETLPTPVRYRPSVPGIQVLPNPVTDNPGPGYTAPVIGDPPCTGPQCGDNSAPVTSLFINSETETDKPSV